MRKAVTGSLASISNILTGIVSKPKFLQACNLRPPKISFLSVVIPIGCKTPTYVVRLTYIIKVNIYFLFKNLPFSACIL